MTGRTLSHYRLVEKIGAGGMGVVYRAHDEQLDRDVAIKVLPPGSLADEVARKRFRKEAMSLARLNHPNIATVHEFGSQDGTDFLVTEYIAGITLDTRLTQGPLPVAEVIRLGIQLAEGLAAAHQQGIVHRDLKPGNLRITTDGRLKILDFGLAQLMPQPSELGLTVTLTKSQETTGTLPYMAPEQLSGQVADARTDIWSAGSVLYEMATGKRPFVQTVHALLINAILNQAPESPGKTNPSVSPMLEQVIVKALDKNPQRRYQTARELAVDLERSSSPSTSVAVPERKKPGLLIVGLLAAAVTGVLGGYWITHSGKRGSVTTRTTPAQTPKRRAIAVVGFKNLSGNADKSWLSTALSEMLTTELSQGNQLRVIPGESVAQMKMSLALPEADSFSPQTLNRIRQNLGSDHIIVGSYLPLGNGVLRVDVRLQSVDAGETLLAVSEKGNESEIDLLVGKAGAELRAKLGVSALSDAESAVVRASLPSNPEAARQYSEGLQKLRLLDAQAAKDLLEKAAALDSDHAPTHSALAEAWSLLGYEKKAKEQAKLALDLSPRFSREERLLIEGRADEILSEMPQAIETYRALWEFYPDNVDYGLALIRSQIAAGRGNDAEATLSNLRMLSVSEVDSARIDLAEGEIAAALSDFKRQQALGEKAASRGRAVGANLLVAQALHLEARAWERMGQSEKTIELSNQARDLYTSAGDRRGAARTLLLIGDVLFDKGEYVRAREQFESATAVFQEIGARKSMRTTAERIGNALYGQGKLSEAVKYYNQALAFDREVNDPAGLAGDYGNLANAFEGMGDLAGALKMHQQSLAAFNEVGDRRGASASLNNLGNVFGEMGRLDDAKANYERSLALKREISHRRGEPYPMSGLADTMVTRGDLVGARRQYEETLVLCKELNNEDMTLQIKGSLAAIALAEKKFADGESFAREAAEGYEKANSLGNSASAYAVLAKNLLGGGNLGAARTAAEKALKLSQQSSGQVPRYEAAMADARVKAKSGKTAEGRKELEAALASSRKFGYRVYALQIRLAQGEIELWSGTASAQPQLAAVEKDAQELGALLVANQAQALRQEK